MYKYLLSITFFCFNCFSSEITPHSTKDDLLKIYHASVKYYPSLAKAKIELKQADENIRKTRSSLFPSLSTSINSQYQKQISQPCSDCGVFFGNIQVDMKQSIIEPVKWSALSTSKMYAQKASLNNKLTEQQHILQVAKAYFDVLNAKDSYKEAKSQEQALKQYKEQAKDLYAVGYSNESDLLAAEAAYEMAKAMSFEKHSEILISIKSIEALIGRPLQEISVLNYNTPSNLFVLKDLKQLLEKANEKNIKIQIAKAELTENENIISMNKRKHLPTVEMFANYQKTFHDKSNESMALPQAGQTANIGVQVNMPLFLGGHTSSEVKGAVMMLDIAYKNLEGIRIEVINEIERIFTKQISAIEILSAQQKSIVAGEKSLEVTYDAYEAGSKNMTDVLNAKQKVFTAKNQYYKYKYSLIIDYLNLKFLCGELSELDLHFLNDYLNKDINLKSNKT